MNAEQKQDLMVQWGNILKMVDAAYKSGLIQDRLTAGVLNHSMDVVEGALNELVNQDCGCKEK